MKKTQINTDFFRHGLTRINTVEKDVSLLLVLVFMAGAALADSGSGLQVYLPRDIKVDTATPTLGQITVLNGAEEMVQTASSIAMGQLALADQRIIIDRPTILGRLASSGIAASNVKFTGAEKVVVSIKNTVVSSEKFLQTATDYIKAMAEQNRISNWTVTRYPQDLLLGELKGSISLKVSQGQIVQPNIIRVPVEAFADNRVIGRQFVDFRVRYSVSQAVAAADIPKDSIVTAENTAIRTVEADLPQDAGWALPYGMTARRDIKQGTAIIDNMLFNPKPQALVKRNQNVLIKIDYPSMTVTANGRAMDDGRAGEFIKVQNNDSKRVITAKVNEDGSVEPVF